MRAGPWVALFLVLVDCRSSQPGCTIENCDAMISACRVEFQGLPDSIPECTGIDSPGRSIIPELNEYCVEACNARPGRGALASCIASKAEACRGARDAGTTIDAVISPCFEGLPSDVPQRACDDMCRAEQKTCDTKCSGGDACDNCLRAGGGQSCASMCSSAGWKACLDCSAQCGLGYLACSDRCPREQ